MISLRTYVGVFVHAKTSQIDGFVVEVDGRVAPRNCPDAHLQAVSIHGLSQRTHQRCLKILRLCPFLKKRKFRVWFSGLNLIWSESSAAASYRRRCTGTILQYPYSPDNREVMGDESWKGAHSILIALGVLPGHLLDSQQIAGRRCIND